MDKIHLLLVSDDLVEAKGLETIFSHGSAFEVLGIYSFSEAVNKSTYLQPDAILLNIAAETTGLEEVVNGIKKGCPCSLVLALVEENFYESMADLIGKGIDGCITRGVMQAYLVKIVEISCRAGIFCMPGSLKTRFSFSKDSVPAKVKPLKKVLPSFGENLTRREVEILQLMAQNCSNREIANRLFISEPTVKTHVSSILRKMGQNNRAQAIVYSYQLGLIDEPQIEHK